MNKYEEAMSLLDEKLGNGRDNLISVATIALEPGKNGATRPVVRCIDAIYMDGAFYATTYSGSNKMKQIASNPEVSVACFQEMFTANGTAENLGWIMKPENAAIREKLRIAFAEWYDNANNESDEGCCILAIRLSKGTLNINHWEKLYFLDFENKTDMENGGVF